MCCRVVIYENEKDDYVNSLKSLIKTEIDEQTEFVYSYNIAPGVFIPVLYKDIVIKARSMRWGLIPFWSNNKKMTLFNARFETAHIKPTFKITLRKQRCLLPVNGYYEWKTNGKYKQPYYFYPKNKSLLFLAGLYDTSGNKHDQKIDTFTILTKSADRNISLIHDRMPVIIKHVYCSRWLEIDTKISELEGLIDKETKINCHEVSDLVNNVRNDSDQLIEKI